MRALSGRRDGVFTRLVLFIFVTSCSQQSYEERQSPAPSGGSVVETGNTHTSDGATKNRQMGALSLTMQATTQSTEADHFIVHVQAMVALPAAGGPLVRAAFDEKQSVDFLSSPAATVTAPFPKGDYAEVGVVVASSAELVLKSGETVAVYVNSTPGLPLNQVPAGSSVLLFRQNLTVKDNAAPSAPLAFPWTPATSLTSLPALKLEADGKKYLEEFSPSTQPAAPGPTASPAAQAPAPALNFAGAVPSAPLLTLAPPADRLSLMDQFIVAEAKSDANGFYLTDFLKGDISKPINVPRSVGAATAALSPPYSVSGEGRNIAIRIGAQVFVTFNWILGTDGVVTWTVPLSPLRPDLSSAELARTPVIVTLSKGALLLFFTDTQELDWWSDLANVNSKPPDHRVSLHGSLPAGMSPKMMIIGERLLALDTGASRLLVWNHLPQSSAALPDVILGQPSLSSSESNQHQSSPSASSLAFPQGFDSDGDVVVVADTLNDRLLVWNHIPAISNAPADAVIGQHDFTSTAGIGANSLRLPSSLFLKDGVIYVQTQDGLVRTVTPVKK